MTVKVRFFCVLFFLGMHPLLGQEAKVIARKGDVQIVDGLDVDMAYSNMILTGNETVILGDDAYISIVDESGRVAETRGPGKIDLNELLNNKTATNSKNAYRFANYILGRMTAEDKKNRLSAMGYFIQSDDRREDNPIRLYMPGAGKYYQNHLRLSWEKLSQAESYVVEIFNMYEELLRTYEANENYFDLNIEGDLNSQSILLVRVSTSDESRTSEIHALKRLGSYHREDLNSDLNKMNEVYSDNNSVSKFVMAGFFEYHNLLADALTCYLLAIEQSPDVPLYREAYDDFLLRNHLIKL